MAGMWDWMPGPAGLWNYLSQYPERYRDQIRQGLMEFSENPSALSAGPLVTSFNPLGPFAGDVTAQAAPLVEPIAQQQNRMYEALTGEEGQLRGEHLAGPLIGSVFRGRLPDVGKTGFYSPTSRALAKAQDKATGQQYIAAVKKEPGASKEAIEGGLIKRLEEAPGTITKEQALSMWNPVELTETVRGEVRKDWNAELFPDKYPTGVTEPSSPPKYAHDENLNLPGGTNPKEILVQMPTVGERYQKRLEEIAAKHGVSVRSGGGYASYATPDEMQELESLTNDAAKFDSLDYTGGHWDEPNVLAHIRTNERDVGGRKALHIEEIQSDWHQQGQKRGYQTNELPDTTGWTVKKTIDNPGEVNQSWVVFDADGNQVSVRGRNLWYGSSPEEAIGDAATVTMTGAGKGYKVPDAPFKKNWHELAFKRALTEAINDPTIERLTWTTGAVQADRYDLSKQISEVHLSGSNFVAYDHDGNTVIKQTGVRDEDLPELIGKEAAEKLLAQPRQGTLQSLTGQDLQVGGEFHKNLYDKKITQFAKKFLKKYGVEPQRIKPGGAWEVFDPKTGKATNYFSTEAEAERFVDDWNERIPGSIRDYAQSKGDFWSIDITPEMREEIMTQGVPLTQRRKPIGLMAGYA